MPQSARFVSRQMWEDDGAASPEGKDEGQVGGSFSRQTFREAAALPRRPTLADRAKMPFG